MLQRNLFGVFTCLLFLMCTSLASAQTVVAYLGKLDCNETTGGAGADDFSLAYGVLAAYDDSTYRSWGGYLYGKESIDEGYHQRGARIGIPLLSMSRTPPNLPAQLEIKKRNANLRFVRVVVCAWERDNPFGGSAVPPLAPSLQFFGRDTDWGSGERFYTAPDTITLLGETLKAKSRAHSADDLIGRAEFLLTPANLEELARLAPLVPQASDLPHATSIADRGSAVARKGFTLKGDGSRYTGEIIFVQGLREIFGNTLPVPQQFRVEVQNGLGAPFRLIGVFSSRREAEQAAAAERVGSFKTIHINPVN